MHPDQKIQFSERFERIGTAANHANSLLTVLIAWYSIPEEVRGSELGEYHLLAVLELMQKTLWQVIDEAYKAA